MARKATKKIAFLGLGRMGGLMTKHQVDAGLHVTGYDPSPEAVAAAKKNGAKTARTVAAAVKGADVVCSSLPSPAVVRSVYLGPKGVLETARRGAVCFELSTSTVSPGERNRRSGQEKGHRLFRRSRQRKHSAPGTQGSRRHRGRRPGRAQGTPRRARRVQQVHHLHGEIRKRPDHETRDEPHSEHPAFRYGRGSRVRDEGGADSSQNDEILAGQRDSPPHPLQGHDDGGAGLFQRHREPRHQLQGFGTQHQRGE